MVAAFPAELPGERAPSLLMPGRPRLQGDPKDSVHLGGDGKGTLKEGKIRQQRQLCNLAVTGLREYVNTVVRAELHPLCHQIRISLIVLISLVLILPSGL